VLEDGVAEDEGAGWGDEEAALVEEGEAIVGGGAGAGEAGGGGADALVAGEPDGEGPLGVRERGPDQGVPQVVQVGGAAEELAVIDDTQLVERGGVDGRAAAARRGALLDEAERRVAGAAQVIGERRVERRDGGPGREVGEARDEGRVGREARAGPAVGRPVGRGAREGQWTSLTA
jgi:hypothetical protein